MTTAHIVGKMDTQKPLNVPLQHGHAAVSAGGGVVEILREIRDEWRMRANPEDLSYIYRCHGGAAGCGVGMGEEERWRQASGGGSHFFSLRIGAPIVFNSCG